MDFAPEAAAPVRIRAETFAIIPEWLLTNLDVPGDALRLYGILRRYADVHGSAHPYRKTLVERMGGEERCSTRQLARLLAALVKAKALRIERQYDERGSLTCSNYHILSQTPSDRSDPGDRGGTTPGDTAPPPGDRGGTTLVTVESPLNEERELDEPEALTPPPPSQPPSIELGPALGVSSSRRERLDPAKADGTLTAIYCDAYQASHRGQGPPIPLLVDLTSAASDLIRTGTPEADVHEALKRCARTNRNRWALPTVVAEVQSPVTNGKGQVPLAYTDPADFGL